jgi:hypothetical protein
MHYVLLVYQHVILMHIQLEALYSHILYSSNIPVQEICADMLPCQIRDCTHVKLLIVTLLVKSKPLSHT